MRREGVFQNQPRLVSDESCRAEIPGTNQGPGETVDAVVNRAPPIKRHFGRDRRPGIERQAYRRAQIGYVRRAEQRGEARVHGVRKERVERVEIAARAIGIATRVVEAHSKARLEFNVAQGYSVVARNGTGQNVALPKGAR